ncbi:MAG: molecular chaperone DnaK, partial [Elusimicrobia bacterium]|nr:molecular chaperone DnaK [Elusimicrobiota bacterium]
AIDRALGDLREAIKSDDVDRMSKAKDELLKSAQKLGEAMYKDAGAKAEPQAAGGPAHNGHGNGDKKDENVVDAEVVDENKKDK